MKEIKIWKIDYSYDYDIHESSIIAALSKKEAIEIAKKIHPFQLEEVPTSQELADCDDEERCEFHVSEIVLGEAKEIYTGRYSG